MIILLYYKKVRQNVVQSNKSFHFLSNNYYVIQAQISFDEEVPTEEQIERMEEKLESAQSEQKNLFLIIFQLNVDLCYFFVLSP